MRFVITSKALESYLGMLAEAFAAIGQNWGSTEAYWERGVKLHYLRRPSRRRMR